MTTDRTRDGIDRPVVEDHGGLLRPALKLDALATGASGALSVAAAPVLADLLGIPLALLLCRSACSCSHTRRSSGSSRPVPA